MELYIGTKIIKAEPQDKDGRVGMKVVYDNGYESWSPDDVFAEAYRRTDNMNFGLAIEAMKKGKRVARRGWNGVGIFLEILSSDDTDHRDAVFIDTDHGDAVFIDTTSLQTSNPYAPKNVVPWVASQTDMLSDDWFIVSL